MLIDFLIDLIRGDTPFPILLVNIVFSIAALLLVFPVHECAHGLMAYAMGDSTAKYQGRLTLNPMAHIDKRGFLFLLILGFGWAKPVEFNPTYFKNRRVGTIATAAAGPLSNILFSFITYFIFGLLNTVGIRYDLAWLQIFSMLFYYMAIYNATFAVFNLIPFPPLDGSKIVGELLPVKQRFQYYNLERYSFVFFIVLIVVLNRVNIIGYISSGLLALFRPIILAMLGGIFG